MRYSTKSKWQRQMFYDRLTYIADCSRYWYFLFNQEVMKDSNYVDQFILKLQILKVSFSQ